MRLAGIKLIIVISILLSQLQGYGQFAASGFYYQTIVRNSFGVALPSQLVKLRFTFLKNSASGSIEWQEDHTVSTDQFGKAELVIGTGVTTGNGTSSTFNQIPWSLNNYFLKVQLDNLGGTNFVDMGTAQLYSVPYALYTSTSESANGLSLSDLLDVNVSVNTIGNLLKWNGALWVPLKDNNSDTVLFAYAALHSVSSDTSLYTFGSPMNDTVNFSGATDSSLYSINSNYATSVSTSNYADTAIYAYSTPVLAWRLDGNSATVLTDFIGTTDNKDVLVRTNNLNVATLKNDGHFNIGNSLSGASLGILGNDGVLAIGQIDSLFVPVSGAGTKMLWYPSSGSFRAGSVSSNQWDTAFIGKYSTAFGLDTKARIASFSSGLGSESVDYSIAIGRKCKAMGIGAYPGGNSVALGDSCLSMEKRCVTIGKNNYATGPTSIAIGNNNLSLDDKTVAIGSFCNSTGAWATTMGFHATSIRTGTFVYSDASSSNTTLASANNQFMVRASGGTIFYTDSLNTMGVSLASGGGSWSVISDKNKKENFAEVDYEWVLNGINNLKIKTWNYKSQAKSIRHIGPMAQDFYATFHIGENNTSISTVDMDGIILSGIKGLNNRLDALKVINEIDTINTRIIQVSNADELNKRLDAIESAINKN